MRQLVLLCDGTNNNLTGVASDTHVVALAELLRTDPDAERVVFYDPGVGNPGEVPGITAWDSARRFFERIDGLAFGRGVFDNIAEGYLFLMRHWRGADDQIWLFGFSRGAFTARSIGGLVNRFGILEPHLQPLVPTLLHLYFSQATPQGDAIGQQASRLFAPAPQRRALIEFVGVWDTVQTVGLWPFSLRIQAKPTLKGKRFVHVRHALALDEHRAQFVPRGYAEDNGPLPAADGRGWKYFSPENCWPIRLEPRTTPFSTIKLPLAFWRNSNCPAPKTSSGYKPQQIAASSSVATRPPRISDRNAFIAFPFFALAS